MHPNPPHLQRNFRLGVLNGALFNLSDTLVDPSLVLAWFLARLSAPNLLIGLIVPLSSAGWALPQLFLSHWLTRQAYKMPLYQAMAVVRVAAWVVITLSLFSVHNPAALITCFIVMYSVCSLAAGVAGLPFMDIVAKTIPPRQRGGFFGNRLFLGGLLAIGAGYAVKLVLEGQAGLAFPANVGLLSLLATLVMAIALLAFINIVEPPDPAPAASGLRRHLRQAVRLPWQNRNFRLYLVTCVVLTVSAFATPFLVVYATRSLGASPGMVGIYLGVRTGAALLSNRLWSWLANRGGGQVVMQLSAGLGLAGMGLALVSIPLAQGLGLAGESWPWAFAPVFVLIGSSASAYSIAGNSLMLNLAPEQQRDIYVGFANTVLGVIWLLTGLGGLLADWTGYLGAFGLAAAGYAVSLAVAARVREFSEAIA